MTIKTILELRDAVNRKITRIMVSEVIKWSNLQKNEPGMNEVSLLGPPPSGTRYYSGAFCQTGCPHEDVDGNKGRLYINRETGLHKYIVIPCSPGPDETMLIELPVESLTDEQLVQLATHLLVM